MTKFLFVVCTGITLISGNTSASQQPNRHNIGISAQSGYMGNIHQNRPNESWPKRELQTFIEENATTVRLINRDQSDERTEVKLNDQIIWNAELGSFNDYLICAQSLYDALRH